MTYAEAKRLYHQALKAELKLTNGPLKSERSLKAALRASARTNAAIRLMAALDE